VVVVLHLACWQQLVGFFRGGVLRWRGGCHSVVIFGVERDVPTTFGVLANHVGCNCYWIVGKNFGFA